jgi:hypothetical protein
LSPEQFVFGAFPFASLGGESKNRLVQAQLLATVGLAEGDEPGAHQEATNNGVNFGLADERERMAGIDETVKNPRKPRRPLRIGGAKPQTTAQNVTVMYKVT